ncbi:MAG: SPOR domain-containing protein [Rhodospirillaceae bacterium]|nr:SPOR domain-containing protein [Rhodospirillaceae bacterium]
MDELRQVEGAQVSASYGGIEGRAAGRAGLRRAAVLAVLVVVLFGFAGIVWYAYEQYRGSSQDGEAPLIRADSEPARIRPDEPGGLEVPHQDRLVLRDPASAAEGEGGDEAVRPPPEEPMPRPDLGPRGQLSSSELPVFAVQPGAGGPAASAVDEALDSEGAEALIARELAQAPDLITEPQLGAAEGRPPVRDTAVGLIGGGLQAVPVAPPTYLAAAEPIGGLADSPAGRIEIAEGALGVIRTHPARAPAPAQPPAEATAVTAPAVEADRQPALPLPTVPGAEPAEPEPAPPPASEQASAPQPPAAAPPPPPPAPEPAPPEALTYRVQLAAVNTDEAARTGWEGFKRSHPDLLGNLQLFIQVVEVNGRTYHRIQGGPLDGDSARRLCQQLRDRGTDCIVRP